MTDKIHQPKPLGGRMSEELTIIVPVSDELLVTGWEDSPELRRDIDEAVRRSVEPRNMKPADHSEWSVVKRHGIDYELNDAGQYEAKFDTDSGVTALIFTIECEPI